MSAFKRIPTFLILFIWIAYLGTKVYNFNSSSDGEVEAHHLKVDEMKKDLQGLKAKLKEGEAFMKTLEAKKEELRAQARKLSEYQGALTEQADSANLVKLLLTEAKKIEIRVDKIEPGKKTQHPFYLEQEYNLDLRGSFQQILLLIHRISQMQRILRIEDYKFKQSPTTLSSRAITLAANLSVSSFQYTLSQEDSLGKDDSAKGNPPPAQGTNHEGSGK
jgi:Tfp pilus assembly protein PilO